MFDRLQTLWSELQRRQVVRAAVVYAAAMWVVIQAATSIFPVLQLPEWLTRVVVMLALAGLPVVLVLAWLFEVRPETGPRGRARIPHLRGWRVAVVVIVLLFTGATVTTWSRRVVSSSGLSPNTIAVLPFNVRGSGQYSYLEQGMVDLLSTKLDGAGSLKTSDARAVIGVVKQEGRAEDSRDGLRIARRLGSGLFVLGDVVEAGGRLHIKATLYNATLGTRVLGSATREGPADSIFTLVDELAAQLLAHVGKSMDSRITRVAAVTTQSLPALKSYLEGEELFRSGHPAAALAAFQRAIAADSGFALAYYRLSIAAEWSGSAVAKAAAGEALARSARLSEHDRYLLEALLAWRTGDGEKAERLYRTIVGRDADDVEAWFQLAEVLTHYGPTRGRSFTDGRAPFERVLHYEPTHVGALMHLARIAVHENKRAEADSLIARVEQLAADGDRLLELQALRAFHFDDKPAQQRVGRALSEAIDLTRYMTVWNVGSYSGDYGDTFELANYLTDESRSANARATGHVVRAHMAAAQGRQAAAYAEIARARAMDADVGVLFNAYLTLLPTMSSPRTRIEAVRSELERWQPTLDSAPEPTIYLLPATTLKPQVRAYLLGIANARLGDVARAAENAKQLDAFTRGSDDTAVIEDWGRAVRAHIALALADTAGALAHLEQGKLQVWYGKGLQSPFYSNGYLRFLRAELLYAEGRREEALQWYRSFVHGSLYDLIFEPAAARRRAQLSDSD